MAFQSMTRFVALALIVLSLGFLVKASPIAVSAPTTGKELATIEERTANCYYNSCYGGLDIVALMLRLQAAIEVKLGLLDGCLQSGGYEAVVLDIEGLLYAAVGGIQGYRIGLLGLLSGKALTVARIWSAIVISIATHCNRWYGHAEFDVFLGLIARLDLAMKLCLGAIVNIGGIFGGFGGLCVGLFTRVQVGLLLKVKFGLCLGVLGLGGY